MRVSVVFGTRGDDYAIPHLQRIFHCLAQQTFQDFKVIVVVDRKFRDEEDYQGFWATLDCHALQYFTRDDRVAVFTQRNADFIPHSKGKASYVRNFGMKQVDTELIQLFDEDNGFDEKYLEKAVAFYDEMKEKKQTEVVICPTLKYRDTEIIQNQGFSFFNYWQSRPVINRLPRSDVSLKCPYSHAEIQMFSGNGLLGSAQLFKAVGYDEELAWIAEDMDFTLSLHEKGAKLFVFSDLVVRHYERDKTKLEQAWIGSPEQASQKAKNWFLFVWKHGKFWDKFAFRAVGLLGCLVRLSVKAIRYGGKQRWKIIGGMWSGCVKGRKRVKMKHLPVKSE